MDRDNVRLPQQVIQPTSFSRDGQRGLISQPRTPRQHPHFEGAGNPGHVTPNMPQPNDPKRLRVQHLGQWCPPLTAFDRCIRRRYLAHQRDRKPDRQLGRACREASGRLRDDHASFSCRGQVNVVGVITGLRDDAQVGKLLHQ